MAKKKKYSAFEDEKPTPDTPIAENENITEDDVQDYRNRNKGYYPAYYLKNNSWFSYRGIRKSGEAYYEKITDFDLVINALIERYNPDSNLWERSIQCYMLYKSKSGQVVSSPTFILNPKEWVSKNDLQLKIFSIAFRDTFFKNNDEVKSFFVYLDKLYSPKTVREYDHFGFIDFGGDKYYLARNVLICIPAKGELGGNMLIAPDDDGYFPLPAERDPDQNHYIALDKDLDSAPVFDLGRIENGIYVDDMEAISKFYNQAEYATFEFRVRQTIQEMAAGQQKTMLDGHIIWAYMNFFLYYDMCYDTFFHGLYLYLFGDPSAGKGKMAEIILTAFGLNAVKSEGVPTLRSIENKLASHNRIPAWLDEFKAEEAPKLQYFNLWFEGKTRGTSSGADRRKNERKFTRTMILFCSNYALRNDDNQNHLRSRCLKILYSKNKRGQEAAYNWIIDRKQELQHWFIYRMQTINSVEKRNLKELLVLYKKKLKAMVQSIITIKQAETGFNYEITDREIQSMAIINTVNHYTAYQPGSPNNYQTYKQLQKQNKADSAIEEMYDSLLFKSPLFNYSVKFLIEAARTTGERDAMSEFLTWCENARDLKLIFHRQHFGWFNTETDQELRIFLPKIWKVYEKDAAGKTVNKTTIFNEFENLSLNGELVNTYIKSDGNAIYGKGYRIVINKLDIRYFYAFDHQDMIKKFVNKDYPELKPKQEPNTLMTIQSDFFEEKANF